MANLDLFSERARRVMDLAQREARRYRHDYLGTEHLLLALVAEREGVAARALANLGVDEDRVRDAVETVLGPGTVEARGTVALAPRAKRSLELAVDEARQLKHHFIGTEHLLLGILREGDNVAVGVLSHLGVTLPDVYEQMEVVWQTAERTPRPVRRMVEAALGRARGRGKEADPAAEVKGNVITCRVTDRDLAAIDALVEAGIRSTRSDAAAWLIGAGIAANGDLFARLNATIDQIRRLRAEAQALLDSTTPTVSPGASGGDPSSD